MNILIELLDVVWHLRQPKRLCCVEIHVCQTLDQCLKSARTLMAAFHPAAPITPPPAQNKHTQSTMRMVYNHSQYHSSVRLILMMSFLFF